MIMNLEHRTVHICFSLPSYFKAHYFRQVNSLVTKISYTAIRNIWQFHSLWNLKLWKIQILKLTIWKKSLILSADRLLICTLNVYKDLSPYLDSTELPLSRGQMQRRSTPQLPIHSTIVSPVYTLTIFCHNRKDA